MPFDPISFAEARKKEDAPLASAVVYKKSDKVIARLYDENREKWVRIAQGQAGVDDATVIQQAINALPNEGGVVFIKAGTYTITTPLTLKSNVKLIGEGIDKTIFDASNRSNATIYHKTASSNITLKGFTVKSENNNAYAVEIDSVTDLIIEDVKVITTGTSGAFGMYLSNLNRFTLRNIVTQTYETGIVAYQCQKGTIEGVYSNRVTADANDVLRVHTSSYINVKDVKIDGSETTEGVYRGIYVGYSNNINLSNCQTQYTRDAGIILVHSSYINLDNCIANYVTTSASGLWARDIQHVNITNCQFNYNYYDGILIGEEQVAGEVSEYITISNCQCINNNQGGGQRAGIRIISWEGTTRRLIITNNVCGDNQDTPTQWGGIVTVDSAGENLIANNITFNNTTYGIYAHESDTKVNNLEL